MPKKVRLRNLHFFASYPPYFFFGGDKSAPGLFYISLFPLCQKIRPPDFKSEAFRLHLPARSSPTLSVRAEISSLPSSHFFLRSSSFLSLWVLLKISGSSSPPFLFLCRTHTLRWGEKRRGRRGLRRRGDFFATSSTGRKPRQRRNEKTTTAKREKARRVRRGLNELFSRLPCETGRGRVL